MEQLVWIAALRSVVGGVIAALGLLFVLGGGIGFLRFPDVYTRSHAVLAADGLGAALTALGLAIIADDPHVSARLILLAILTLTAAPFTAHATAGAAHAGGLSPLSGTFVAPRPGAKLAKSP